MDLTLSVRENLPPYVAQELDNVSARIAGVWETEHDGDGAHTDVTADTISVSGLTDFESGVHERNRTVAMGVWEPSTATSLAPSPGFEFGVVAPAAFGAGTQHTLHQMRIGETLFYAIELEGFTIAVATSAYVTASLPVNPATGTSYKVKRRHRTFGLGIDNGTLVPCMFVGLTDEIHLRIYRYDVAAWAISAGNSSIFGQWHGEVY